MLVRDYIDINHPTFSPDERFEDVIQVFKDANLNQAAVVEKSNKQYLGLISKKDIEVEQNPNETLINHFQEAPFLAIKENETCLEALRLMNDSKSDVIPVLDENDGYKAIIKRSTVLEAIAESFHVNRSGVTLSVLMEASRFAMYDLIRIIEQEEVKVMACSTNIIEDENPLIRATIKLNSEDSKSAISAIRRHGYVIESLSDHAHEQEILDKVEEFMHYLSV